MEVINQAWKRVLLLCVLVSVLVTVVDGASNGQARDRRAKKSCHDISKDCATSNLNCLTFKKPWALIYCRKYCGFCKDPGSECRDKLPNCEDYNDDVCTEFRTWAMANCRRTCDMCGYKYATDI